MLNANIDLAGVEFSPIGNSSITAFNGTFDGCGHTIKNLSVDYANSTEGCGGFFGWLNGTIKNVNFENADVVGSHYVGVICAYNQSGSVINCKVNSSKANAKFVDANRDGDKCGGAIGFVGPNTQCVVKDIAVSNTTVLARRNAAQVIGYCYPSYNTIDGLSATNVTVDWNEDTFEDGKDALNISQNLLYNE